MQLVGSKSVLASKVDVADCCGADCAGAAIGYIYSADTAPRYTKGLWVSVGITVLSMVITVNHVRSVACAP